VRLLLDTHVLLWWLADDSSLGADARSAIAAGPSSVYVSAAPAWEMSIKQAMGKLEAPADLEDEIERNRFGPLPISIAHASAAGRLARHHDDPFDRMLVAQALAEGLTLVTNDRRLASYGVPTLAA